jgi:hypothetical protein
MGSDGASCDEVGSLLGAPPPTPLLLPSPLLPALGLPLMLPPPPPPLLALPLPPPSLPLFCWAADSCVCDSSSAINRIDAAQRLCRPGPSRCCQLLCMMTGGPADHQTQFRELRDTCQLPGVMNGWLHAGSASGCPLYKPTSRDGWHACIATDTQVPCGPCQFQQYP